MPFKASNNRDYSGRGEYHGPQSRPFTRKWTQKPVQEDLNLRIKYNCRFCGTNSKRILHPSSFLLPCGRCSFSSHIKGLTSNYHLVFGKYQCQERRCGLKWVQRLPFRSIVLNTPLCGQCSRRTKVGQVKFRGTKVSFKNSLLFKCQSCSKCKSLSMFQATQAGREGLRSRSENSEGRMPSNPECEVCRAPMTFLKNLRTAFTVQMDDGYYQRPRSFSPKERPLRPKAYEKRQRLPRSHGDSPKYTQSQESESQTVDQTDINYQN